jgi:hypothetical protein
MEMNMVFTGDFTLPANVSELRVPIHFADSLKTEGLKVGDCIVLHIPRDILQTIR